MPRERLTDLIGVPFKVHGRDKGGLDCWGVAMEVFRRYGVRLPDCWYESLDDSARVRRELEGEVVYLPLEIEKEPCLLLLRINGSPHAAVYIGEGYLMHATRRYGVCVEPLSRYRTRIEGIYDVCNHKYI